MSRASALALAVLLAAGCARVAKTAVPSPAPPPASPPAPAPAPETAPALPPAPTPAPAPAPPPAPVKKPPAPAPAPPPPATPPPVVSPQLPPPEEERLRREASVRIEGTERLIGRIDERKLAPEQQEVLSTIQSFLAKAKTALSAGDFQRAFNLADKAGVLAEDLSHAVR